jgi:hypothetical protein
MISFSPGIKLNARLSQVIQQIAPFAGGTMLKITSGLRDPIGQLSIIGKYAAIHGVKFSEYQVGNLYDQVIIGGFGVVYRWQQTWSRLLHLGIIVNPPLAATCLEDYTHPSKGFIKAGTFIQGSPHIQGTAFDISAANNKDRVVDILSSALAGGADIKDFLIERENNCVHVNIKP